MIAATPAEAGGGLERLRALTAALSELVGAVQLVRQAARG